MTALRRLPLPGGAASFWDWTASLCSHAPAPSPGHRLSPTAPSPAQYTAHQPLRGPVVQGAAGLRLIPGSPRPPGQG